MTKIYTKNTWVDEVLGGEERYDILADNDVPIEENVQINLTTPVITPGTTVDAEKMNNIEDGIDGLDNILSDILNAATELTISSDAITVTQSGHKLQPESGTSDNLSTVNGTNAGQFGFLTASDYGTDTITIKHNVGNILCAGGADITLSYGCVFWYSDGTKIYIVGGNAGGSGGGNVATDEIWDAAGDLAVGTGANTAARLARGTGRQQLVVKADVSGLEWIDGVPGIFAAAGDLVYGTGADAAARLALGTAGKYLKAGASAPSWENLPTSSDTVPGIIEIATAAETTTGTDATRAITPDGLAGSKYGMRTVYIKVLAETTALTTGDGKAFFTVPWELNGWNLLYANAAVYTASSSGMPTIQIRNVTDAVDILYTAITIDANEYSSYTAATSPYINASYDDVATGDIIAIDVDAAGTGTAGLDVILTFQLP